MCASQESTCTEVQDACKALRSKAKVSDLVVEREPLNMQREKQSQKVVEEPQLEMQKNLYRFDVDGISMELPTVGKCEKAMQLMLEREKDLHAGKSEPQDVEQPHVEYHGVGATTHANKFHARWVEGVHAAIPPGERWGDMHE